MERIAPLLLPWFEANKRLLPFRQEPSAYHIWVSEIMLQQTRVAAALPYYERFIRELPDAAALAACDADTLHKLWQGLGYYNRVNNMQKAARVVCERYGGELPADYDALRALPGIGELIGGSQREERLDVLTARMAEMNMPTADYEWYLDLRRFGSVKHAGYGLGFERLLMYVTGIPNIRDVLPFPRTTGNAEF